MTTHLPSRNALNTTTRVKFDYYRLTSYPDQERDPGGEFQDLGGVTDGGNIEDPHPGKTRQREHKDHAHQRRKQRAWSPRRHGRNGIKNLSKKDCHEKSSSDVAAATSFVPDEIAKTRIIG